MKKKNTSIMIPKELYKLQCEIIKETGMNISSLYKQAFREYIKAENYTVAPKKFKEEFRSRKDYIRRTEIAKYYIDAEQEEALDEIRERYTDLKTLSPIKLQAIINYCKKMANELEIEYQLPF